MWDPVNKDAQNLIFADFDGIELSRLRTVNREWRDLVDNHSILNERFLRRMVWFDRCDLALYSFLSWEMRPCEEEVFWTGVQKLLALKVKNPDFRSQMFDKPHQAYRAFQTETHYYYISDSRQDNHISLFQNLNRWVLPFGKHFNYFTLCYPPGNGVCLLYAADDHQLSKYCDGCILMGCTVVIKIEKICATPANTNKRRKLDLMTPSISSTVGNVKAMGTWRFMKTINSKWIIVYVTTIYDPFDLDYYTGHHRNTKPRVCRIGRGLPLNSLYPYSQHFDTFIEIKGEKIGPLPIDHVLGYEENPVESVIFLIRIKN